MSDEHFETLSLEQESADDHEMALRHAPLIRFDAREPFLPSVVGYTVFRNEEIESPSFPRTLTLPEGAVCGIEYAVWWDWDIQHLYELEHIWVYLDDAEQVIAADASWHGGYHQMVDASGNVPLQDGRVILYSEPGKHAFAPVADWLAEREPITRGGCGIHAGKGGVLVTDLFEGYIDDRNPINNQVVWTYLERRTFEPAFTFSRIFDLSQVPHVPWNNLFEWIPGRVTWWAQFLNEQTPASQRRVIRIAHRGASAYAQENSLTAIRKAAEMGSDMVEVDVRITVDHVPVIIHDENLQRVFGVSGSVSDFTLDELIAMTPDGLEPIMSLEALIDACRSLHIGLYLDIKQVSPQSLPRMVTTLREKGMLNAAIFGSFRPDILAEIKALEPKAQTSILFSSTHVEPVALAQSVGCDYVHPCWERFDQPHELLTEEWLGAVRGAGLGIICWHEERPAVIYELQQRGVNGICSDEPELLLPRDS